MFPNTLLPELQELVADSEGFNVRVRFDGTGLEALEFLEGSFARCPLTPFLRSAFSTREIQLQLAWA